MSGTHSLSGTHSHVFLGDTHETSERRTWAVIWLCGAMMVLEIVGGLFFGSIALVADGMHMSTHAGALLLAALAYTYARKHAEDARYTFGTGKLGDLAGFTSAVMLAMIALLIGYESVTRLFSPVEIRFAEAIPIACLGLAVNVASAWLLSSEGHRHHGHSHDHAHDEHHHEQEEEHRILTPGGTVLLTIFETNHRPVFRLRKAEGGTPASASVEIRRSNGECQTFAMVERGGYLESSEEIPEPHAFVADVLINGFDYPVVFEEHGHAAHEVAYRDNNMRAAVVHVVADAAVSVLVIAGLLMARTFGWLWMDPLAGIVGAVVIASWAYGLVRDTGAILLDMNPDRGMTENVRKVIEAQGDRLTDLHIWRLGPGHLGAIVSVSTANDRTADFYREKLAGFSSLSHLTVEVAKAAYWARDAAGQTHSGPTGHVDMVQQPTDTPR